MPSTHATILRNSRKRRKKYISQGRCGWCGKNPISPDSVSRCDRCLVMNRVYQKKKYRREQFDGRCRCGKNPIADGLAKCLPCTEKFRDYFRRWKEKRCKK
jgi:hypothetical protein